jgi:hypothetical protein
MAAPTVRALEPRDSTRLVKILGKVEALRDQLEVALEERDREMGDLHDQGYSYEAIARVTGDLTHIGVFRAIRRREVKDQEAG